MNPALFSCVIVFGLFGYSYIFDRDLESIRFTKSGVVPLENASDWLLPVRRPQQPLSTYG